MCGEKLQMTKRNVQSEVDQSTFKALQKRKKSKLNWDVKEWLFRDGLSNCLKKLTFCDWL